MGKRVQVGSSCDKLQTKMTMHFHPTLRHPPIPTHLMWWVLSSFKSFTANKLYDHDHDCNYFISDGESPVGTQGVIFSLYWSLLKSIIIHIPYNFQLWGTCPFQHIWCDECFPVLRVLQLINYMIMIMIAITLFLMGSPQWGPRGWFSVYIGASWSPLLSISLTTSNFEAPAHSNTFDVRSAFQF